MRYPHYSPRPYPYHLLGKFISPAVHEKYERSGIEPGILGPLALGAATLYTQDLVNVERPNMPVTPVCLYFMIVADSGAGKDAGGSDFFKPARDFQNQADADAATKANAHEAECEVWRARRRILQKRIAEAQDADQPTDELKRCYQEHLDRRVPPLMSPQILFTDATYAGMTRGLEGWQSAMLLNLEAGDFLNGRQGLSMPWWNERWGGAPLRRDLADGRQSAQSPRLSLALALQVDPLRRFWQKHGVMANDIGFFARILFSMPPSTNGSRLISLVVPQMGAITQFQERAKELLQEAAAMHRADGSHRRALAFSFTAALRFVETHNHLQTLMAPYRAYVTIPGVAAKAAEMIARVAAVLHTFDGLEGPIEVDTLQRAEGIVRWHVEEFLHMTTMIAPERYIRDAFKVEQVLLRARTQGRAGLPKKELPRLCPVEMTPKRLDQALRHLLALDRIFFFQSGRHELICLTDFGTPPAPPTAPIIPSPTPPASSFSGSHTPNWDKTDFVRALGSGML